MTLNEFRIELEGEMKWAGSLLAEIEGIEYSAEVESNGSYLFGVVMLANPGMAEDERIYISLEADMDIDNNVDREDFEKARAAFRTRIGGICETLTGVDDPASALVGIAKEIDAELDKEYQAELAKIERETKDRIRIALMATAVLFAVAAIAIIVRLITR